MPNKVPQPQPDPEESKPTQPLPHDPCLGEIEDWDEPPVDRLDGDPIEDVIQERGGHAQRHEDSVHDKGAGTT